MSTITTTTTITIETTPWRPTASELASILDEMRPVIDRFAERDRRLIAAWSEAA